MTPLNLSLCLLTERLPLNLDSALLLLLSDHMVCSKKGLCVLLLSLIIFIIIQFGITTQYLKVKLKHCFP
jgi:hypothetical protein